MTFKINWEKTDQHTQILPQTITCMVAQAFPEHPLLSYEIISGGCANLNIKITIENTPYILRVYLRDKEAAFREANIAALLKYNIPIPETVFIGNERENSTEYRFAITQFKDGIPLHDLLLNHPETDWQEVMIDAGRMLTEFQRISFPHAGFLDENLGVPTPFQPDDLFNFVIDCLKNPQVQNALGDSLIHQIKTAFETHRPLLITDYSNPSLVHGDFDSANILVHEIDDKWQISAILDWEFASSGSWLWDVANMLRYSHKMPSTYEESFLQGLEQSGFVLPENWRTTIALMTISSLLDILARNPIPERPILRQDICELIEYMVQRT